MASAGRVVILDENLPVPFDRRVWLEATALQSAGYDVLVICPRVPGLADRYGEMIEGVRIARFDARESSGSLGGYLVEYSTALVGTASRLLMSLVREPPVVIHACNPPDLFFMMGLLGKVRRCKFVYDQHDLAPENYVARYGAGARRLVRAALILLERLSYASADLVLTPNESMRQVAIRRGHVDPRKAVVVATGPDNERVRRVEPRAELKRGREHLAVYVGVMGPQDGVEYALKAAHAVVRSGRRDVFFAFLGSGDEYERLARLAERLGLQDEVLFAGRVSDDLFRDYMSTADLGLSPDPLNGFNEYCTMNKTLEYMAFGLPIVAFDLEETRRAAGGAALYARPNSVADFAEKIVTLLEDKDRRIELGALGQRRVRDGLSWDISKASLVDAYARITQWR